MPWPACARARPYGEDETLRIPAAGAGRGSKVTWPTRKETLITTAMVFVMAVLASIFFLAVDMVMRWGVSLILGLGS
jgi:preprotein translocase subunit SecE